MTITLHAKDHGFHVTPLSVFQFPGGEQHIKGDLTGTETEHWAVIKGTDANEYIAARMWADSIRGQYLPGEVPSITVIVPYLPAARADRGTPFGAGIYADLINQIGADRVICFDPHSPVMPGLINNITSIDSTRIVRQWIVGRADRDNQAQRYTGIIAPDKGAHDRAKKVADACHLPLYQALKHRDEPTGQLSGFTCEDLPADGKYLIVDDICDGGGTFKGLAKALNLSSSQLGLFVSHGIFSGAAASLTDYFGEIWTTDSLEQTNTDPTFTDALAIIPISHTLINN